MTVSEAKQDFERISAEVFKRSGGYDAEVHYVVNSESLTRFANNIIHQNVATDGGGISIRLQKGLKTGIVSIGLYADDDTIARAVQSCKEVLEHSTDNPDLLPMLGPQQYEDVSAFCEMTAQLSPDERAKIAEKAARDCEREKFLCAGAVENATFIIGLANSKGLYAFSTGTDFGFSITVEGDDGTGWAESKSWTVKNADTDADIAEAIDIARRNQKPRYIEPGRYTVVLPPAAVSDLMLFLAIHGFNSRAHLEGRSFLAGKLEQKVFSEKLFIYDDAYEPRWSGLPFDFEGVPRKKVQLVSEGVLAGLVYDRLTAEKMNAEPTGHGMRQPNQWGAFPSNIVVAPGDATMEEMIASVKHGLLVTHFHYTNVSELTKLTLTGMTRDGLFVIENGKIAYPVKNLRFTQSIAEAMNNIIAVGKEQKLVSGFFFGGVITPGMMIENFTFSSTTEFGG